MSKEKSKIDIKKLKDVKKTKLNKIVTKHG
jgi:hypothetical protein